jgi:hypothetical protein
MPDSKLAGEVLIAFGDANSVWTRSVPTERPR